VKGVRLAQASLCASALVASSCYWLARYDDLSSDFGDAGANADAQSDREAGPVVDAGPSFCPADAGSLVYCMDFDGVDAAVLHLQVNEASVGIVSGHYVSPPSSLFVQLQGDTSSGMYDVSFPLRPRTTRLEFEIQTVGLNEGVTTLGIVLLEASTQTARSLNVVVAPYGSFQVQEFFTFADGGGELGPHSWSQVDAGGALAWHHVVLTLTVDDAKTQYTSGLTVDGVIFENARPLMLPWVEGNVTLKVGVTYAATFGQDFFFDNVRADFEL
jgi:hypothetical protein